MKFTNVFFVTAFLIVSGLSVSGQEKKLSVDNYIKTEIKKNHIPGAAVAVLRNGKVEMMNGYGLANIEQNKPVTLNTEFQIGSTTKPFTAMAIMLLVEDGKIIIDEKASKYLVWLPEIYRDITVRQLLTHTSGVRSDLRTANVDNFSLGEFKRRLATAPASFKTGEKWEYANTGYILLGMIIEAVTGKSYGEFLEESIFKPLGMNNTKYNEPTGSLKNGAIGYDWQDDIYQPSPYFAGGYSAGAISSSLTDLAKWEQALTKRKLLKQSSYEQIWTPISFNNGRNSFDFRGELTGYGFGWFLTSYKGHKLFTHSGTVSGFSSAIYRFVDGKVTFIVITNSKAGADRIGYAEVLGRGISDIYFPARKK